MMKITIKKCFIAGMLLANSLFLSAQKSDRGLWTSIEAEKKLSKNWDLGVEAQYRRKDNISATDQMRGGVDIFRKAGRYVKLGAGYELIADKKAKRDIFEYRNRFRMQATGSYKYARFTASWRTRMQLTLMETDEPRGDLFGDNNKWVWRNRFALKYDIRGMPLKPYVNYELFHQLFSDLENSYYQNRFSAGIEYRIAKRHTIEAGWKLETEIADSKKHRLSVIKIGYLFSF